MIQYDQFQLIQKALAATAQKLKGQENGQSAQLTEAIQDLALAKAYIERSEHVFFMKESDHHRLRS
ncbi:hypothetical protein [Bacillus sp. 179-C3.3 HS]|uniref:hypothetical protein n=1 Tax=Bacillus sp. 179-C3.3 HS TaxID=3232162 RepID=UPI00399FBBFD